jgi:hypothetical protein
MKKFLVMASAALLCLLQTPTPQAETLSLEWGKVFSTKSAPENVYFRARYLDQTGKSHQLQVWRQADLQLRRRTDDRLDLYLDKNADGNYSYRLVDYARRVIISTDRANLYRIGILSDWSGLAHVLNFPRGDYTITPREETNTTPEGKCIWYQLETAASRSASQVCWSDLWGLPLSIQARTNDGEWTTQFTVEEIHAFYPVPGTFDIPRNSFLQIDARPDDNALD